MHTFTFMIAAITPRLSEEIEISNKIQTQTTLLVSKFLLTTVEGIKINRSKYLLLDGGGLHN